MAIQFEIDEIEESSGTDSKPSGLKLPARRRVGNTDRMFFTEQLALLLETGESLFGALTTIVKQTQNAEMRAIVSGPLQALWRERGLIHRRAGHRVLHTTGIPESRLASLVDAAWAELDEEVRSAVGLAFLPGGKRMVTAAGKKILVWDLTRFGM